jgi:hypothetical protein
MTRPPAAAPFAEIWDRFVLPFDAAEAIDALVGPTHGASRQVVGAVVATSEEAHSLLTRMPQAIRSLAISTTVRAERCVGQVRGPILWSETAAAQASAAGDMGILVCSLPEKEYDTPQNQVLVAALSSVHRAAHAVDGGVPAVLAEEIVHQARLNGSRAKHYLDHRALSGISARSPSGRDLLRTRSGNRRRTYEGAVAMLARAGRPLDGRGAHHLLVPLVDAVSATEHQVLAALLSRAEARGHGPVSLRLEHGAVEGGPVAYRNHRHASADGAPAGIFVGEVRVDCGAPRRTHGVAHSAAGPVVTFRTPADLDQALELAGF